MKIAIIGTRGIPNNYGGFEQFAEYLAKGLVKKGYDVSVYNSHSHPYRKKVWNGVKIIHKYDPENILGTSGQFIYDLNCILSLRKRSFDIILQLGYTSSSIWSGFLPKNGVVVTNMDGLEWKRTKYPIIVKKFLLYAEKWAVYSSDYLISDSVGIQDYLKKKYQCNSEFIAYGATNFSLASFQKVVDTYAWLKKYKYDMLVARMEPENNIETILDGFLRTKVERFFLVIGGYKNNYGNYLYQKYSKDKRVKFLGGIYDIELLNNLRYYSNLYFHGHSVGGTNPSLLEAMASKALVCAHDNTFNRSILGEEGLYFNTSEDVRRAIDEISKSSFDGFLSKNSKKIEQSYSWDTIVNKYEAFIQFAFDNGKRIQNK